MSHPQARQPATIKTLPVTCISVFIPFAGHASGRLPSYWNMGFLGASLLPYFAYRFRFNRPGVLVPPTDYPGGGGTTHRFPEMLVMQVHNHVLDLRCHSLKCPETTAKAVGFSLCTCTIQTLTVIQAAGRMNGAFAVRCRSIGNRSPCLVCQPYMSNNYEQFSHHPHTSGTCPDGRR